MKHRIERFDTSKSILIILVVVGHVLTFDDAPALYENINKVVYTFHVPAFFIISGMLFNTEKWKMKSFSEFLVTRVKTLIIPYCFFEILSSIIQYVLFGAEHTNLKGHIYNALAVYCNAGADWFLIALFEANILFFIYLKAGNRKIGYVLVILSVLVSLAITDNHWLVVLVRGIVGFGLVLMGYLMRDVLMKDDFVAIKIIISLVLVAVCSIFNSKIRMISCEHGNPILFLLGCIAGTYIVLQAGRIIHGKYFSYIGRNTLIILGTHQVILDIIRTCIPDSYGKIQFVILTIAIILIAETVLIGAFNKFIPVLVGKNIKK